MATRVMTAVVKQMDAADKDDAADAASKLAESQAALHKNWGPNFEVYRIIAQQAAKALGVAPDAVSALEHVVGYEKVMDMFRAIGSKIGEDKFFTGNSGSPNVMTREMAVARRAELLADKDWSKRYSDGGKRELNELMALQKIIVESQNAPGF
jgi:hypothetical protein